MARIIGQPLMPWQEQVAMVAGELLPDGRPAYRTVAFTVPRQSGKTTLVLAWELQRALGWAAADGPQRIVYSAQTGNDARKKLVEDQLPLIDPHKKALGMGRPLTGMGNEAVPFLNGSRIVLLASSEDSGHGKTVDLAVLDELFADKDNRRDQAVTPAMNTKRLAQLLACSTMGTDDSVALNQLVAAGRAACESGKREGIAYFEWSAADDDDPDSPDTWWRCMPALGHTIEEFVVADARAKMKDSEFRRAYLNQLTRSDDRVMPVALWDAACSPDVKPAANVTYAVDVNPERTAASIAAASGGSIPTSELLEHRAGVGWLAGRVAAIVAKRPGRVLLDKTGPAGSLVTELERLNVIVDAVGAADYVSACGAFYDRVMEGRVALRVHSALEEAAAGVAKRQSGDAWAWARKHDSVDVCPLVAVTLAVWGATRPSVATGLSDPNDYDD
jgi:hypothetical protein